MLYKHPANEKEQMHSDRTIKPLLGPISICLFMLMPNFCRNYAGEWENVIKERNVSGVPRLGTDDSLEKLKAVIRNGTSSMIGLGNGDPELA